MATLTDPTGATTTDLGNVERISRTKSGNLIPISAINQQEVYNILGISRTMSVNGTYTGTTAVIQTFISEIQALIDGTAQDPSTFSSTETGSLTVYIDQFSWVWEGVPSNRITYEIKLLEDE